MATLTPLLHVEGHHTATINAAIVVVEHNALITTSEDKYVNTNPDFFCKSLSQILLTHLAGACWFGFGGQTASTGQVHIKFCLVQVQVSRMTLPL